MSNNFVRASTDYPFPLQRRRTIPPRIINLMSLFLGFFLGACCVSAIWITSSSRSSQVVVDANPADLPVQISKPSATPMPKPLKIDLVSVKTASDLSEFKQQRKAKGIFIIIKFTLTNNSSKPITFSAASYELTDAQGRHFAQDDGATMMQQADRYYQPLNPGLSSIRAIVFDVPSLDSLQLTVYANYMFKRDGTTIPIPVK